jgi:hypothetical protein
MNTLGITNSENYEKSVIAMVQLNEAINLFVNKKFIPSITLAGASEEIFAGLLVCKGMIPVLEESYSMIENVRTKTGLNLMEGRSRRDIIKEWNHIKNRTKHHDKDENDSLKFNACDEAYWLIRRSIANAKSLNLKVLKEPEFENWVIINACL